MITCSTAIELKKAGLKWEPELHDFFFIPGRNLDDRVFVLSDMYATVEMLLGTQVVSFLGASEWALDYLITSESVWLPTEAQLREKITEFLYVTSDHSICLVCRAGTYGCIIYDGHDSRVYSADDAAEAYGQALLFLMKSKRENGQ